MAADRLPPSEPSPFSSDIERDTLPDGPNRSEPWTMRQPAGAGSPEQTNQRLRAQLAEGQTGLALSFDFPTLMGDDSDAPRALGEIGLCGVAVDSLRDLDALFLDIPLDKIAPSLAINGPAIVLFAFYVALADQRGIPRERLAGTVQNDCLGGLVAQQPGLVGLRPAMRLATDLIEFCSRQMPRWNTVSIGGYHAREAGATAAQEIAFALASSFSYIDSGLARGLAIDDFAPSLSFFFALHSDFFEEIAKLRAARRLWARLLKERYGARRAESLRFRVHTQTAGSTLTAQQPQNNAVRVALQALAAVLGGTQSLHTGSLDETYALPTPEAAALALRTQQIIAEETGVAHTVDPLGGSHLVEWMTDKLETEALAFLQKIDALGGMVAAAEQGYPQREIAASSYRLQRQVEQRERIVIGVNRHENPAEGQSIPLLRLDEAAQKQQIERLRRRRASRDQARVAEALARVRAATGENLVEPIIAAARAEATEQEICDLLRASFGAEKML